MSNTILYQAKSPKGGENGNGSGVDMADYEFMPDGSVKTERYGAEIAYFDDDGTVKATRYGQVLGWVGPDGTVKQGSRYGREIGFVESDGTVRKGNRYGQVLDKVDAPVHRRGALLLLLG